MVLMQKWPFFQLLFFRKYRLRKCLLRYSRTKKRSLNLWFWTKNGHFSNFYFLGNTRQENFLYDILERKNAFPGCKKKKFKKSKNWHFFKGVNLWFWTKNGHFFTFYFLGNTGQENVFYDIPEQIKRLSRL